MINNVPFFRFPFYPYPRRYSKNFYHNPNTDITDKHNTNDHISSNHTEIGQNEIDLHIKSQKTSEKKSSKYHSIGPIFINTDGFSNKEEPLVEFSGLKLYLDDFIILSLLFFLYKEEVKDDMLFILPILLLIG